MMQRNMKARQLGGMVLAILLGVLAAGTAAPGTAPPIPTYRLNAAQKKQIAELETRLARAAEAGHFAEALRLARELASLRPPHETAPPLSGASLLALGDPVFDQRSRPLPEAPPHGLLLKRVPHGSPAARRTALRRRAAELPGHHLGKPG
jgi:hypothetical protein